MMKKMMAGMLCIMMLVLFTAAALAGPTAPIEANPTITSGPTAPIEAAPTAGPTAPIEAQPTSGPTAPIEV